MAAVRDDTGRDRWAARPVLGGALRIGAVVVPVVVGVLAGIALTTLLPVATTTPGRVLWFAAVIVGSTAALLLTDRLARRALPLAVLLELSLVFPDRAPSRLRAARTPSVRELENRLLRLRRDGIADEPIETAETLVTLVGILGLHDKKTRGHSERVRAFTDLLTTELGLDEDERMKVRWSALVHDLGKLVVPSAVLNGGRDISDEDWAAIRRHPTEGERLAAGLLPWLGPWGSAIVGHHERWDGTGYPSGLAGEDIGLGARIVAVADSFEVMTSARSYSKARSAAAAREELTRCAGAQFDPQVVRAFLAISLGRLRWVLGPVTWLAQLPFAAAADRAGQAAKGVATAAVVGGLVAGGTLTGPGGPGQAATAPAAIAAAAPSAAPVTSGGGSGGAVLPGGSAVPPDEQPGGSAEPVDAPPRPEPAAPPPADGGPPAGREPVAAPADSPAPGEEPAESPAPADSPDPDPSAEPSPEPPPSAEPSPSAEPPPSAEPEPSPESSPSPAASPSAPASPAAGPSPSASPSPSPSPSASPSPVPVSEQYDLAADGSLRPSPPTSGTPATTTLAVGGSVAFDLSVPTGTALSGTPHLAVHTVVSGNGNGNATGHLRVTLADCSAPTTCAPLATGDVQVNQRSGTGFQLDEGDLSAVTAVVAPGHVLRLTLELDTQGNATQVVLGYDATSAPSRLDLPAAPPPAAVRLAGPALALALGLALVPTLRGSRRRR